MFNQECYCAQYKGPELAKSTSGGVFFAFSKYVIEQGGAVYGAAFSDFPNLNHICAENIHDLAKIQGSKYLESNFVHTFPELKQRLEKNQLILFGGTPCQVAALKSFLKIDYPNLLTIDILCHGTPSKKLFSKYIAWREKKWNTRILNFEFRSKRAHIWSSEQKALISTDMGEKIIPAVRDPYFFAFQKGLIAQTRCYSCKYASPNRVGDITAADFWGINTLRPNFPYENGASCMLINTAKGNVFLEHVKKMLLLEKVPFEDARKYNPHFNHPLKFDPIQKKIYQALADNLDFAQIIHFIPYKSYLAYKKSCLKKWIKQLINVV